MSERLKAALPLAIAVAVVAAVYVELSLNFTFHWATSGDLGNGLHLPASFHLVTPAAFVTWAMFFALGADGKAARSVVVSTLAGSLAALLVFAFVAVVSGLPDFWAIAIGVGVLAGVLVLGGALGEWFNVPTTFGAFACCVFWWIATGLDGWAAGGGGDGSVAGLAAPETAGTGAFGGVLSTPYGWVAVSIFATLLVGVACGLASVRLSALLAARRRPAAAEARSSSGAQAAR